MVRVLPVGPHRDQAVRLDPLLHCDECGSPANTRRSIQKRHGAAAYRLRRIRHRQWERYCDDVVVHCKTEQQARFVLGRITERLARCKLEVHPDKTRIVYCKDADRQSSAEHERFDYLGYTFRPRLSRSVKYDRFFVNFSPAVSDDAGKAMRGEIRNWKLHLRSDKALGDLARMFNTVVQGWINYYGRYYPSMLYPTLRNINRYLVRWARRKYRRLRIHKRRAYQFLVDVARREPNLFAHWRFGLRPGGWVMGAG